MDHWGFRTFSPPYSLVRSGRPATHRHGGTGGAGRLPRATGGAASAGRLGRPRWRRRLRRCGLVEWTSRELSGRSCDQWPMSKTDHCRCRTRTCGKKNPRTSCDCRKNTLGSVHVVGDLCIECFTQQGSRPSVEFVLKRAGAFFAGATGRVVRVCGRNCRTLCSGRCVLVLRSIGN